jgi:hypothetical protein
MSLYEQDKDSSFHHHARAFTCELRHAEDAAIVPHVRAAVGRPRPVDTRPRGDPDCCFLHGTTPWKHELMMMME